MEEWKEIKECPDYQISSLARVKNKFGKILRQHKEFPTVDFYVDGKKITKKVARLYYNAFVGEVPEGSHLFYRDGNVKNISKENLLAAADRRQEIIEAYKNKVNFNTIANTYKLSVKTIKNMLCNMGIEIESKEFSMPKHNSKGKVELSVVIGEFHIPYADNCTVRPRTYREHYSQVIWR